MKVTEDGIRCPFYVNGDQCSGILELNGTATTDLGIFNGVDHNHRTEHFTCSECGEKFKRGWRWEQVGGEVWEKATAEFYERQEVKDLLLVMKESIDKSPGLTLDEINRVIAFMLSKLKAMWPLYRCVVKRAAADQTLCRLKPFYDPMVHEAMERLHSVDEDDE